MLCILLDVVSINGAVTYSDELLDKFLSSHDGNDFDLGVLKDSKQRIPSSIGWGQMIQKAVEVSMGMWNEEFLSWGAEDCEFYYRLNLFGFKVGRVVDDIYHFEHGRTFNSHYHNPKFQDNDKLWQWIRNQDRDTLAGYYSNLHYLKVRGEQLNAAFNQIGNLGDSVTRCSNMQRLEVSLQCVGMSFVFHLMMLNVLITTVCIVPSR